MMIGYPLSSKPQNIVFIDDDFFDDDLLWTYFQTRFIQKLASFLWTQTLLDSTGCLDSELL
jgi:hypothetical protein